MNINLSNTNNSNKIPYDIHLYKKSECRKLLKPDEPYVKSKELIALELEHDIERENFKIQSSYDRKFNEISHDYDQDTFSVRCYALAPVVDPSSYFLRLDDLYKSEKEYILKNYSGDEQTKRINMMENSFKEHTQNVMNEFIGATNSLIAISELRARFERMSSRGVHSLDALDKQELQELEEPFNKMFEYTKKNFAVLKELLANLTTQDGVLDKIISISSQVTKTMNKKLSKDVDKKYKEIEEIHKLVFEKEKLYNYNYENKTDEEKYQQVAKNKKEIEKIDNRLKAIIEEEMKK